MPVRFTPCSRKTLSVALAGSLAALAAAPSSAGASISSTSGIHLFAFGSTNGKISSKTQAVSVAKHYDIAVGSSAYKQWLSTMKSAHSGMLIAQYRKGTGVIGADYTYVKTHHPSWFLHSKSGGLIKSPWGAYLIDPGNSGVRSWQASWARSQQSQGWSAVYLDAMGTYALQGTAPIDPRTHKPFTISSWLSATTGLAKAVSSAVGIPLIVNGLHTGTTYWAHNRTLVSGMDGGVFENCFIDPHSRLSWYPSLSQWLAQLTAIEDVQAHGKYAICMLKPWGSGTSAQRTAWYNFARASFMLATGSRAYFNYTPSPTSSAFADMNDSLPIGSPTTKRYVQSGVYKRNFTNGLVAVNPSSNSVKLGALPGGVRLRTASGASVTSSTTLAPHSALVAAYG